MERKESAQANAGAMENMTSDTFVFSEPNVLIPPKVVNSGVRPEQVTDMLDKKNLFTFASPMTVSQPGGRDASIFQSSTEKQHKRKISRHSFQSAVNIFAQALMDTTVFTQLKKNSKSHVVEVNPAYSITCTNVPQPLLTKAAATEYFTKFGYVLKIAIRIKKQIITVTYATKEEANVAYHKCGEYLGKKFNVEWTKSGLPPKFPTKKKDLQMNIAPNVLKALDDEVKSELGAMMNLEYNLHNNFRDSSDGTLPKKSTALQAKPVVKSAARADKASVKSEKLKSDSQISDLLPNATIEELQNIIQQPALTSEDKYKVLEARDRLMRLKQVKSHTLAAAKVMIGTCPDMCPEKERLMRESMRQVALYEQLDSNEYRISHTIAVKQYSRSSADQEEPMAHELRPVKSLKMTMSYLLHEIADLCDQQGTHLGDWYHFMWDRTRGIRKDITQQELCCTDSVELVEQCARFHIVCSERLCAEEPSIFDKRINSDNLTKCLQSLKYMYHDLRVKGITCNNEPEFRAYIILLNLNNGNFMWDLQRLPRSIQKSPEVRFALEAYSALESNNYYKFFKAVRKTTYLNACILLRYFNQVRLKALSVMVKAYCRTASTAYPLYELIDILGFEDENEALGVCEQVGLNTKDELHVLLNRQNFTMPLMNIKHNRACGLIESKRIMQQLSIGECIAGKEMPEKTYKYHKPHNSFDIHGYLLPVSVNAQDQSKNIIFKETDPYEFIDEDALKFKKPISVSEKSQSKTVITTGHTNIFKSDACSKSDANALATMKSNVNTFVPKPQILNNKLQADLVVNPETEAQKDIKSFCITPKSQYIASTTDDLTKTFSFSVTSSTPSTTIQTFNVFSKQFEAPPSNDSSNVPSNVQQISKSANVANTTTVATDNKFEGSQCCIMPVEQTLKTGPKQVKVEKSKLEEQEHAKKMQQINQTAEEIFNVLQTKVVQVFCSDIASEEINQININNIASKSVNEILDEVTHEMCDSVLKEERDNMQKIHEMSMKRRQRKALDDTPVWLQKRSSRQCAELMYCKEQDLVIQNMCKKQDVQKSATCYIDSLAPIEVIISIGMKENLQYLNTNMHSNHYWKLVISWPNLHNNLILRHNKKIMNRYLCPHDYTNECILKDYPLNQFETLYICIRHFEGVIKDCNLVGSDALLFIADASEDIKIVIKRLTKNILSRDKLMPIPLVFIVLGDTNSETPNKEIISSIESLLKSGYLSIYTIMYENDLTEETILNLTQSALLWLSINKSPQKPLEIDNLCNVCDNCLTEELWLRILDHSSFKGKLSHALKDPNFIINLHNEVVDHLIEIILDQESLMYTKFAPELKRFVQKQGKMPWSYEYIDDAWTKDDYKVKVEIVISSFKLPQWKYSWPIHDTIMLRQSITNYCQEALSSVISDELSSDILSNLFFPSGVLNTSNFIDIVLCIVKKKICLVEPLIVIYNKNHMKHFRILPWWLKSSLLTEYEISLQDYDTRINDERNDAVCEPIMKKQKLHKVKRNDSEFEPLAVFCENSQSQVMEVHYTSKKIEDRLKERRKQNFLFEERLKDALLNEIECP